MKRFSISLVFQQDDKGKLTSLLRVLITEANSEEEAIGKAIKCFEKETEGYSLAMKVIVDITKPSTPEEIINYIEQAEIGVPIEKFFNPNGEHITKKEYGKVLIETLCQDLREKFINK